jgi:hypothetical protein
LQPLEKHPCGFEFVYEIPHDVDIVGGDDEGAVGHFFNLTAAGIGDAGEKVDKAPADVLVGRFEV